MPKAKLHGLFTFNVQPRRILQNSDSPKFGFSENILILVNLTHTHTLLESKQHRPKVSILL